jgi:hypothetical protein
MQLFVNDPQRQSREWRGGDSGSDNQCGAREQPDRDVPHGQN